MIHPSYRGNKLNIVYKGGVIPTFNGCLHGEGFKNIKSKEAAESILARRNNESVIKAVYIDYEGNEHYLKVRSKNEHFSLKRKEKK